MTKIVLTKALKENRAVIVQSGHDCPEGFIEIAGCFTPTGEISIAVPENLMGNNSLIKKLSDEASNCLTQVMKY